MSVQQTLSNQISSVKDGNERPVVQIPMTGGASFLYNNPGCDLRVTQTELVDIFLGNITTWEEVGCDGGIITVVHRSDGSGTTADLLHLCLPFSLEWRTEVGSGKGICKPLVSVVKVTLVLLIIRNTEGVDWLSELWLCEWWSVPTVQFRTEMVTLFKPNERDI